MNTRSIFIALVVCFAFHDVSAKIYLEIPNCDIDKIHTGGSIILTIKNNQPIYVGNFNFPNEFLCKAGKNLMKFANGQVLSHQMQCLFAPFTGLTTEEMRFFILPANLIEANVSHNNIQYISQGMYLKSIVCNRKNASHF